MLKILMALTNVINTSSSYDSTIRAPFRFEKITASYDDDSIKAVVDYYVNTNELTDISLTVNGYIKNEILSERRAKKSLRKITLLLPNDGENNTLKINFAASFSQNYNMDGTFYFDNGDIEEHNLDENGEYKYKIVKEIMFINKTQTFLYKYNYINLNILPNKNILYNTHKNILKTNNKKIKSFIKINRDSKNIFEGITEDDVSNYINTPGNYEAIISIKYKVGEVKKTVKLKHSWNVLKNYIGGCKDSYICLLDDKITGILQETISTNMIL